MPWLNSFTGDPECHTHGRQRRSRQRCSWPAAILDKRQYEREGILHSAGGRSLRIEGLWALAFGKGVTNNGNTNTLYFTAGAVREQGGVFGFLTAAATPEGVAGRP